MREWKGLRAIQQCASSRSVGCARECAGKLEFQKRLIYGEKWNFCLQYGVIPLIHNLGRVTLWTTPNFPDGSIALGIGYFLRSFFAERSCGRRQPRPSHHGVRVPQIPTGARWAQACGSRPQPPALTVFVDPSRSRSLRPPDGQAARPDMCIASPPHRQIPCLQWKPRVACVRLAAFAHFAGPRMKKTGSEIAPSESEQGKAAPPAEPV